MSFKKMKINNFRGIKNLELNDIKQINLITGKNNCGKTSIMEAIFLLIGMSNPQLTINIHNFRDLLLTNDEDFSYLFNNLDFKNIPQFQAKLDFQERQLSINPIISQNTTSKKKNIEEVDVSVPSSQSITPASTSSLSVIEGIKLNFNINKKDNMEVEIRLRQGKVTYQKDYKEGINATFINPRTIMSEFNNKIDALLVKKNLTNIITSINEIEPKLTDIRAGALGVIYADIGIENLIPINIMGDGLRRILSILTVISEKKNGVVLIDEIENGLHYSSLSILWKTIFKLAKENNVQIFATTHSYECVKAFVEVYQESKTIKKDEIRLFRIDRENENHTAYNYNSETLIAGIEKDFEVR